MDTAMGERGVPMTTNKKLEGSAIADFIPQILTGDPVPCPLQCPDCYYNLACEEKTDWVKSAGQISGEIPDGEFIPTLNGAGTDAAIRTLKPDAIVRVNSGLDSNLGKDIVLERTRHLPHKFYNTSLPNFDFPGPVVFTANPGWLHEKSEKFQLPPNSLGECANIMFVRFRVGSPSDRWVSLIRTAAMPWRAKGIPIVLTFMRYTKEPSVNYAGEGEPFEHTRHFDHEWWQMQPNRKASFCKAVSGGRKGIYRCSDGRCADCKVCESLYWLWYSRRGLDRNLTST